LGVTVEETFGGSGLDLLAATLVIEQIARVCPALAVSYGAHSILCVDSIRRNGTEDQKKTYLPDLCSGRAIGCLALTEPNAGSDAVSLRTTATRAGDFYYLSGTKMFITNAPEGQIFVTYAKTDPQKKAKGISTFIVENIYPGFSVSRKLEKMGNRGSATGEVVFQDCRVPAENLMGQENEGIRIIMSGLDVERAFFAGEPLGIAEGALELALKYSLEREQFGKPISQFQLIQAKLADMYTRIEAARFLVYRAAMMADQATRGGKGTEVHKLAAAAILFTSETATWVANEALQVHGGYGYMMEYAINRFYRDAKLYEIGAGTSEIRRLIIGQELVSRGLEYP
jgi:isovaleryl-CoA dehydrogenase